MCQVKVGYQNVDRRTDVKVKVLREQQSMMHVANQHMQTVGITELHKLNE